MANLHRNNGAEWVMVAVLTPIAWLVRLLRRPREKSSAPPTQPRSTVMIEGLPQRQLN